MKRREFLKCIGALPLAGVVLADEPLTREVIQQPLGETEIQNKWEELERTVLFLKVFEGVRNENILIYISSRLYDFVVANGNYSFDFVPGYNYPPAFVSLSCYHTKLYDCDVFTSILDGGTDWEIAWKGNENNRWRSINDNGEEWPTPI